MKSTNFLWISITILIVLGWALGVLAMDEGIWRLEKVYATHPPLDHRFGLKAYSETISNEIQVKPDEEEQVIVIDFQLTAVTSDQDAVKKMTIKLEGIDKNLKPHNDYEMGVKLMEMHLGSGTLLSTEEQTELTGEYRMFDMEKAVLIDSSGNEYPALWGRLSEKCKYNFYLWPTGKVDWATGQDAEYWHKTVRANEVLVGLLDVGHPVTVSLVYKIPDTVDFEKLSLRVGDIKPISVVYKLQEREEYDKLHPNS